MSVLLNSVGKLSNAEDQGATQKRVRPSHVIMPFLGCNIGGSHIAGFRLGSALTRFYDIDCVVICPSPSAIADEARRRGFSVFPSNEPPAYRHSSFHDIRRLAARVETINPYRKKKTIMHFNDMQALKSWGPAAKMNGIPLIYHHRSLGPMKFLKRCVLSLADHAICISTACSNHLSFFDRRTMVVDPVSISDGIDRTSARAGLVEEFGLDPNARLIGFVANFFERKRPFFFLDVCARLAAAVNDYHAIVFGGARDIEEHELRAYADNIGLGSRITFAGFRLPPARNIAALDLLLAPALDEPFGLTLAEALLLGVPYVATSSAGHIETHQRWSGGRLVSEGADAAEFAGIALEVLRNPGRTTLDHAQREKAQKHFSPKRHADDVLRIYEAVMTDRELIQGSRHNGVWLQQRERQP